MKNSNDECYDRVLKRRDEHIKRMGIRNMWIITVVGVVVCLFIVIGVIPSIMEAKKNNNKKVSDNGIQDICQAGTGDNIEQPTSGVSGHTNDEKEKPTPAKELLEGTIVCATYPDMVKYPDMSTPNYDQKLFTNWEENRRERLSKLDGYSNCLDSFVEKTMKQFLCDAEGKNKVYSPINVYMALAMLAETTGGSSREQILSLLGTGNTLELRKIVSGVWNSSYVDDGTVTSILANSIWLSKDIQYKEDTMNTLAKDYYASSYSGEMGSDSYNQIIQSWLNMQTGGLLKEQAGEIKLNNKDIMALVSTVYYKAKWKEEFNKNESTEGIFREEDGNVKCTFMNGEYIGEYYEGKRFSSICRKLENSGNMYIFLPNSEYDVDSILTDDELYKAIRNNDENKYSIYQNRKITLSMPKFDIVSSVDLGDEMKKLGVTDIFDSSKAKFTNMVDDPSNIRVSQMMHAGRVKVDEDGIEAAAYTVLASTISMIVEEKVEFTLNRPFLFVITGDNGLPLFAGIVNRV